MRISPNTPSTFFQAFAPAVVLFVTKAINLRAVDWIRLLCIQTWCLWWFVDGTNVACLFDTCVCYLYVHIYYIVFNLRRKPTNYNVRVATRRVERNNISTEQQRYILTDGLNQQRWS